MIWTFLAMCVVILFGFLLLFLSYQKKVTWKHQLWYKRKNARVSKPLIMNSIIQKDREMAPQLLLKILVCSLKARSSAGRCQMYTWLASFAEHTPDFSFERTHFFGLGSTYLYTQMTSLLYYTVVVGTFVNQRIGATAATAATSCKSQISRFKNPATIVSVPIDIQCRPYVFVIL